MAYHKTMHFRIAQTVFLFLGGWGGGNFYSHLRGPTNNLACMKEFLMVQGRSNYQRPRTQP